MQEEEFTLKQLLKSLKAIFKEAKKRIKVFFFILLFVGGISLIYSLFFNKPKYEATITFMINEDGGQGLNSIMNFASQIGIGVPEQDITGDKVQDLLQSERIIFCSLLYSTQNNQIFGNELIDSLKLEKRIKKFLRTDNDFHFAHNKMENMQPDEIRTMGWLSKEVKEIYLTVKIDKSEIIECTITTSNQICSKILCEQLVTNASNFYINKKVEKNKILFNITQVRLDSIKQVLFDKEMLLNKSVDATKYNVRQTGTFDQNVLKREVSMLNNMYMQTADNLDKVKFEIESKTPIFQMIDKPYLPLEPIKLKAALILFLMLFFSALVYFIYLIFVKIETELN